jgi:DNA-binding MarR family transcriptional regulator
MRVTDQQSADVVEVLPCSPAVTLVASLGRWASRQFPGALKPIGLKPRHLRTLLELRNGPLAQQSLGDAVGVDAAQLVGLLNDLESEDLVHRRRSVDDRRRHIVEISESGRARLALADRAMADLDARLMAGLDPQQRAQFITLLRFIAERGDFEREFDDSTAPCEGDGDADADADECPSAKG